MITREESELISKMALKLLSKNIELDVNDDSDEYLIIRSRDRYVYPDSNDLYKWVDDQLSNIRKNQDYYMKHYGDILSLNEFGIKLGGLLLIEVVSKDAIGIVHCKAVDHNEISMQLDIQIGLRDQLKEDYVEGAQYYTIVNQITYCGNIVIIRVSRSHFNLLSELVKLDSLQRSKDIEVVKSVRLPDQRSFVYVYGDEGLYDNDEFELTNGENVKLVYLNYYNIFIDALNVLCSDYKILDISCHEDKDNKLHINLSVDKHSYYSMIKSSNLIRLLNISMNAIVLLEKDITYDHKFNNDSYIMNVSDNMEMNKLCSDFMFERLRLNGINSLYQLYLIKEDLNTLKYISKIEADNVIFEFIEMFKSDNHSYKCPKCGTVGEINLIPDGLCPVCSTNIKDENLTN